MVSVGDIERTSLAEGIDERLGVLDLPECVSHAEQTGEVVERLGLSGVVEQLMYWLGTSHRKEDQSRLGTHREQVIGAVLHFVRPRLFVLFDKAGLIFVERAAGDDADLDVRFGGEAIDVEVRLVLDEVDPARKKLLQVGASTFEDLIGGRIRAGRKLGLGSRNS